MKIKNIFLALLTITLIFGCEEDDGQNSKEFSDLKAEQHKENMEESGLQVANKMGAMADMQALHILTDFQVLLESTFPAAQDDVAYILQSATNLQEGTDAAFNLKSTTVNDTASIVQVFNQFAGVYTFDPQTESWAKETSDSEMTFHFPTEGSNENNATLSFTNLAYIENPNPETQADMPELLESLDGSLTVNDEELISMKWRGAYNEEGLPEELSEEISMQEFLVTSTFTRSESEVSFEQAFAYQGDNILTSAFSASGDFDQSTLAQYAENDIPLEEQNIISNANIEVTVDTFKFEGMADWAAMQKQMEESISDSGDEGDSNFMELLVEILNENVVLYIRYADSNEIVAESEFYVSDQEQTEYTDYTDLIGMRMVFGDGSAMDDSFFGSGFDNLITRVNELMVTAEENYGVNIQ